MRIALVSTVSSPVRRDAFGSVETWTWLLTRELRKLGHEITIFGCAGSEADAEIVTTLSGPYATPGSYDDWQICEWINLCRAVEQSSRFDVLHSQAYLWGIPLENLSRAPMVHTLHIVPDETTIRLWENSLQSHVTAISRSQWSCCPNLKPAAIIPHAVDSSLFTFREQPDDYVLFLGRFVSGKGPIQAIETAKALGLRLLMAGPENKYFREQVQPLIDGNQIEYVGYAEAPERNKLLGGARALLYPIQYSESFGLVLIEAMLCGTPIAAMNYGAVPEIVEEGISGYMASTPEEFIQAVPKCFSLDRLRIRQLAQQRYSPEQMARAYADVYEKVCAGEPVITR